MLKAWFSSSTGVIAAIFLEGKDETGFAGQEGYEQVEVPAGYLSNDVVWDETSRDFIASDFAWLTDELHRRIDAEAGAFRQRFLTTVPGQEMTYLRKEEEARAFVAGSLAQPVLLAAEAQALGSTVEDVAAAVIAKADQWTMLGAAIEGARLGAKAAVASAEGREAKEAAAIIDWEGLLS